MLANPPPPKVLSPNALDFAKDNDQLMDQAGVFVSLVPPGFAVAVPDANVPQGFTEYPKKFRY